MEKFKVCPACGSRNDPRSMECASCSADLMGIPVVDEEQERASEIKAAPPVSQGQDVPMVKICDCGERNPAQARKCQRCGEDLTDILPVQSGDEVELHYQLATLDGDFFYRIPCGETIIGREQGMGEYLSGKPFVSRSHARLIVEDGKLYIENLSGTNFTYVKGIKIPAGRTQLNIGDEVSLGGIMVRGQRQEEAAYFVVGVMP